VSGEGTPQILNVSGEPRAPHAQSPCQGGLVSQEKQLLEYDSRMVSYDQVLTETGKLGVSQPERSAHHSRRTEKHSPRLTHSSPVMQPTFPHATSDKNRSREKMKQRRQQWHIMIPQNHGGVGESHEKSAVASLVRNRSTECGTRWRLLVQDRNSVGLVSPCFRLQGKTPKPARHRLARHDWLPKWPRPAPHVE